MGDLKGGGAILMVKDLIGDRSPGRQEGGSGLPKSRDA